MSALDVFWFAACLFLSLAIIFGYHFKFEKTDTGINIKWGLGKGNNDGEEKE